jgi:tetratricopeptide (TPR) repeat protein
MVAVEVWQRYAGLARAVNDIWDPRANTFLMPNTTPAPPIPSGNAATLEPMEPTDVGPAVAEIHVLSATGRHGEALAIVTKELARNPGDGELLFARGCTLFDWGRVWEARDCFLRALECCPARPALFLNLAWSCAMLGLPEEAERHVLAAIAADPASVDARFGLGTILQGGERFDEAIASYLAALALAPDNAHCLTNIGACKFSQKDYVGAEEFARRALTIEPDRPDTLANLGSALAMQERYEEGLAGLKRAAEAETALRANSGSFGNYGYALMVTGQVRAAAEFYRRNLPALPDASVHRQYSYALLTLGQLREGWIQHEFRWYEEPNLSKRPKFAQPPWVGQNLVGKTILLRSEQGAGDIMQFARFAAPLKSMGATTILQVPDEIRDLAEGFDGVDRVVASSTPAPAFDYYISVMSIPAVLETELATIPAKVPYLRVDPAKLKAWRARIDGWGLKVGLVWAGNPAHLRDQFRSLPFDLLCPLWEVQGVQYFSLQKQPRPGDVAKFPPEITMIDLGPKFADFGDTAAAIAQLDLILCVDTAVAHLAGALGKPVWLMLPEIGDFRWLLDREDSPWYPTMRLFRQRQLGEWGDVIARVKVALEDAVCTGTLIAPPPAHPATGQLDDLEDSTEATIGSEAVPEMPQAISCVAETRYGILQYVPNNDEMARSIAWFGEFLQAQIDLLARLIAPDDRVLEVGSGIGAHAIPIAKMLGPKGHLFLYEPQPIARRILQQNLAANRVAQKATLMRRAISGTNNVPEDSETLDELLLDRLDILKIQSFAKVGPILSGASATLWRLRPKLFIAALDDSALGELALIANEHGYRCWRMATPLFNPGNFNRRTSDIFSCRSALILLAIPEEIEIDVALDGCVELT